MRARLAGSLIVAALLASGWAGGGQAGAHKAPATAGHGAKPAPRHGAKPARAHGSKRARSHGSKRARSHGAKPAGSHGAKAVARTFAQAYARYLDGNLPASALPDASGHVRKRPGQLMPARARHGSLAVRSVSASAGGKKFVARLADQRHSFNVTLTVRKVGRHERVVRLVAPDFDSILGPPTRPIPQPAGSGPAEQAVRGFMRGYLRWLYGHGPASAIHDATPSLLASFKANPPNVPPTMQGLTARLAALGMERKGGHWQALANVTDGDETYTLVAQVVHTGGRWLVSSVGAA